MRRFLIATAVVLAVVVLFLLFTIPPAGSGTLGSIDQTLQARTVAGAYHVHTTKSDGSKDPAGVAHAAAQAGLRFVIFTDHGNGTRRPDAPVYREGVLCLDAVEISTTGGHYVALGMSASSYPLGGEPAAVVEDVKRLGGFGVAAHPDSVRPELAWTDWTAPFDGVEWLSADSEWRNESRASLARLPFDYLFRPAAAMASVLDRPVETLARWDRLSSVRRVVGLAAHDAHGGMRGRMEPGPKSRIGISDVPSYEASFRSFAIRAIVARALSGRADNDAALVLDAIREGRVFTAIDAVAAPAFLDFHGGESATRVEMGGIAPERQPVLMARATLPQGGVLVLLHNGREIRRSTSGELQTHADIPGAYRIEAAAPRAPGKPPIPWMVSNPIYVGLPPPEILMPVPTTTVLDLSDCAWHVEKDASSEATLERPPAGKAAPAGEARLAFRLGGGGVASQFVALACDLPPAVPRFDELRFHDRAAGPARISVQLRFHRDGDARWIHSVYVDSSPRDAATAVSDLVPASGARSSQPPGTSRATTILFVVNLTNAVPGSAGAFEVSDLALARRQ